MRRLLFQKHKMQPAAIWDREPGATNHTVIPSSRDLFARNGYYTRVHEAGAKEESTIQIIYCLVVPLKDSM